MPAAGGGGGVLTGVGAWAGLQWQTAPASASVPGFSATLSARILDGGLLRVLKGDFFLLRSRASLLPLGGALAVRHSRAARSSRPPCARPAWSATLPGLATAIVF